MKIKLLKGNNIELLKTLPENSIDSVVTDPPYGLSFMGKKWDYDVPSVEFWKEVFRVLKPGGHVLSFGGTRTYHRMVVNIEDAGFEIRDQIMWLYGSGFPKSLNIGKAVDKLEGNEREVVEPTGRYAYEFKDNSGKLVNTRDVDESDKKSIQLTKGNSPYEGWGTALKPANEPICLARKPLSEKTIAENVLKWKTGGINIDGCRVGTEGGTRKENIKNSIDPNAYGGGKGIGYGDVVDTGEGRFPANIILDEDAGRVLDEQSGVSTTKANNNYKHSKTESDSDVFQSRGTYTPREDKGGASRFFYVAKVSKKERNLGCEMLDDKSPDYLPRYSKNENGDLVRSDGSIVKPVINKNTHPTVKPINLMTYLCRLITPPNGIVLDPFMGSGSTGIAAQLEGFRFCGMEMDGDYFTIAEKRINNWEEYKKIIK